MRVSVETILGKTYRRPTCTRTARGTLPRHVASRLQLLYPDEHDKHCKEEKGRNRSDDKTVH